MLHIQKNLNFVSIWKVPTDNYTSQDLILFSLKIFEAVVVVFLSNPQQILLSKKLFYLAKMGLDTDSLPHRKFGGPIFNKLKRVYT
mgnify:CR=1 FL=1